MSEDMISFILFMILFRFDFVDIIKTYLFCLDVLLYFFYINS